LIDIQGPKKEGMVGGLIWGRGGGPKPGDRTLQAENKDDRTIAPGFTNVVDGLRKKEEERPPVRARNDARMVHRKNVVTIGRIPKNASDWQLGPNAISRHKITAYKPRLWRYFK